MPAAFTQVEDGESEADCFSRIYLRPTVELVAIVGGENFDLANVVGCVPLLRHEYLNHLLQVPTLLSDVGRCDVRIISASTKANEPEDPLLPWSSFLRRLETALFPYGGASQACGYLLPTYQ